MSVHGCYNLGFCKSTNFSFFVFLHSKCHIYVDKKLNARKEAKTLEQV